ncbi:HsmA family protein [Mesobacillus zeae]|uniref:TIGR03987 family protein n=1 Tax=Mesobacillus zeae TaxID=1917180 RepID=A0A398B4Q2_9BACI|nr:HsmA family protein [Mesobacillus zeae]RID84414.1 TIGR03987 family protein [Mesobacillus zeae]
MLLLAIVSINLALIFYTIGVFGEKRQQTLKKWHVSIFWIGLLFDTLGTTAMGKVAGQGFGLNFHAITGMLAILLMLGHAIWATVVLLKNDDRMKASFHKFSIIVWAIWLVPFISGAIYGITS